MAARLKSVLAAWRFSRQVDGQVIVGWLPRDRTIYSALPPEPYSPSLIWDLPAFYGEGWHRELFFMEGDFRERGKFPSLEDPAFDSFRPDGFKKELFEGRHDVFVQGNHMQYQFVGESRSSVEAEIRDLFATLPMTSKVQGMLQRAQEKLGTERYVALHVRRGDVFEVLRRATPDIVAGKLRPQALAYVAHFATRTAPFSFYYQDIQRAVDAGEKIVFFSDTPETYRHFADRFGEAIVIDGSSLAPPGGVPIQYALVDFLLIGHAKEVIGTGTGYATIAAQLCGSQLRSVTANGPVEDLLRELYDEVFAGAVIPADLTSVINEKVISLHDMYQRKRLSRELPTEFA